MRHFIILVIDQFQFGEHVFQPEQGRPGCKLVKIGSTKATNVMLF